jgi:arylsulfatase A-like enzyme
MMNARSSLARVLFASLTSWAAAAESRTADRPNIIFILCDDLGPGDLGVLWQNARKGKQKFSTPNMDQFAREGMILSRHYCPAPSCMASRSSLMTGRHQGHCARRNTQFDAELPDVHTLGTVMKQAGYATAAIGKWGMQGGPFKLSIKPVRGDRSSKAEPSHPLLRGFDYFYGYTAHRDAHYHYPKLGNRPLYDGFVDVTDRLAKCYSTDLLTARAKKWIIDHYKVHPQKPFFTYLCYTAPHSGLRIPTTSHLTAKSNYPKGGGLHGGVQWLDDAANGQINTAKGAIDKGMHPELAHAVGDDGQPWPDHARRHATMVRRLDDALADLIQLLKDLEIDDRTLVVLTSDNGTLREAGLDNVGFYHPDYLDTFGRYDGTKLDLWEGGVRMPTIVRWPSVIKAGSESGAASQFHDWMATFCELSGIPVPAVSDGVSIVPTLTGKGKQLLGIVYSEFLVRGTTPRYLEFEPSRRGRPHGQMQSVLIGDYKGIRVDVKAHQDTFEVYHTLKDPKETVDLAGQPGVPTQKQFQAAVLRSRRIDPLAKRPYDNALIPAVKGLDTRAGLMRKAYPGTFDWVPQFDQRQPSSEKVVKGLAVTSGAQQFAGYLRVPKNGVYHFALTTNGKAVVRLHRALLIDADSQYKAGSKALSGKIGLQSGLHPFRIYYLGSTDAPAVALEWQVPGGQMKAIAKAQFCVKKGI